MELTDKLEILADAAKYDASCASSGAPKRSSDGKEGFGATSGMGKAMVAAGDVFVDGAQELRKTAKIRAGQVVRFETVEIRVVGP